MLALCSDETTLETGRRLGVAHAETIPGFYHLGTLRVQDAEPASARGGDVQTRED